MTDHLAPAALRLCAQLCRALGWRPEHFWHATPAEIACVVCDADAPAPTMTRATLDALLEQDSHG